MYKPIDADVIIIGGGIAGLTAAFCLLIKEPTLNIIVLERSERIGGRAFSVPLLVGDGRAVSYFDLGRQWVCKEQNQLLKLLEKLGIPVISTHQKTKGNTIVEYKRIYLTQHRNIFKFLSPPEKYQFTKFIIKVETLCQRIKEKNDAVCIKELSQITLEKLIQETVSSRAVKAVIDYIVFFNCGIQSSQISALFYVFFCISTNGITNQLPTEQTNLCDFRIKGGAQNICEKIADTIGREHILTKELVTDITSNSNYVEVTTKNCSYCCYNVIIAVAPKDILKIKFEPTLPRDKIQAIENTSTNIVTNFVVTYPSDFWTDMELNGDIYVFDKSYTDGPIDYCCNITKFQHPAFTGKIFAGKITSKECPVYKEDVLWQLAEYFGDGALNPTDYYEKSWFMNSSQMVCWNVGNDNYITNIGSPNDRIFWTGAETSAEWYGDIAGGVSSGTRAALEVLYDLRPSVLTPDDMMILSPTRRSRREPIKGYEDPFYITAVNMKNYIPVGLLIFLILWRLKKWFFK